MIDLHHDITFFLITVLTLVFYMMFQVQRAYAGVVRLHIGAFLASISFSVIPRMAAFGCMWVSQCPLDAAQSWHWTACQS